MAIAVPNWQEFDKIKNSLIADGFEKDKAKHQRFYYGDYEIDVVPYGYVAKEDDNIYWPPEETIAMSVKGFGEVLSDAITVSIDDRFTVKYELIKQSDVKEFRTTLGQIHTFCKEISVKLT